MVQDITEMEQFAVLCIVQDIIEMEQLQYCALCRI